MKRKLLLIALTFISLGITAQNYNPVINYSNNGTPTHGIKIKTNIPFSDIGMPTIIIEGYEYPDNPIGIILNWYVYQGDFYRAVASSFGNYTPEIKLYKENNNVVIFINDKTYYDRFSIRAYSGDLGLTGSHFSNWEIVDALPIGANEKVVTYKNKFSGDISFPNGIWRNDGKVGIGTVNLDEWELAVNGEIRAKEIKVETGWSDFVFEKNYNLPTLTEVENHINKKGHLKDIPSANEVKKNGIFLGKMDSKLLQKIEELTLYTIAQEKKIKELESLNTKFIELQKRIEKLEKK